MKIMCIVFYCPSLDGYVDYPVRADFRRIWHEDRIAEEGTKDFSMCLRELEEE